MSTNSFVFIKDINEDAFSSSINISNMLYLSVSKKSFEDNTLCLSVFFESSAPPLIEHDINPISLRNILCDIVLKNNIQLMKIDDTDILFFIPLKSILYTRDVFEDSKKMSLIVLSNSNVIKSKKHIDRDFMINVTMDHLSIDKII